MQIIMILIYAVTAVSAVTLVKLGNVAPLTFSVGQAGFSFGIGWITLLGLLLYIVSFLIYMTLVSKNNLTYLTPVSSGMVYILTMIVSLSILKEQVTPTQWAGWGLILAGLLLMNLKK